VQPDARHDVFISYSLRDKAVADAVCARLEANGVRCWIAPRDVIPGEEWAAAVVAAINGARALILVFSAAANSSPSVRREVECAANREIPILPFRIEDASPAPALEFYIAARHWLDAMTPPLRAHIDRLAETLGRLIDLPDRVAAPTPVPPPAPPPPAPSVPVPVASPVPGAGADDGEGASRTDAGTGPGEPEGRARWRGARWAILVVVLLVAGVVVFVLTRGAAPPAGGNSAAPATENGAAAPASGDGSVAPTLVRNIDTNLLSRGVAFSADGASVMDAHGLWSVASGARVRSWNGFGALAKTPDSSRIAVGVMGSPYSWARLLDGNGNLVSELMPVGNFPAGEVALGVSADSRLVMTLFNSGSAGDNQTSQLVVWDASTGQPVATLRGISCVAAAAFAPDGQSLFVAPCPWLESIADRSVQIWSFRENRLSRLSGEFVRGANELAVSPDGRYLALDRFGDTIVIWDIPRGRTLEVIPSNFSGVMTFSPDSALLLTAGTYSEGGTGYSDRDGFAIYHVLTSMRITGARNGDGASPNTAEVRGGAFAPNGRRIVLGTLYGIQIWDIPDYRQMVPAS
jgi:hypothetical protein